ncbi:MAG: hypothetical protein V4462_02065 [Pseudomonadota bacterium]
MNSILLSDEDLKRTCAAAEDKRRQSKKHQLWLADLAGHLQVVSAANRDEFCSEGFQKKLWNSEAISGFGRGGAIDVSTLIKDQAIVARLWALRSNELPAAGVERTRYLISAYNDCHRLIEPKMAKFPRLKLYNVFASLQPTEFATISFTVSLRLLAKDMGIDARERVHAIEIHRAILDRLNQVLGPVAAPPAQRGLERMTLPWLLLGSRSEELDAATRIDPEAPAGYEKLVPLPADRRRRGMLAIGGSFATVRSMIEFAKDGCSREDFKEHIRSINSRLSPSAVGTNLNALIGEWGVLQAAGDRLELTARGEALLDSADPEDVSDWLLTRILGFDNILHHLQTTAATRAQLLALLKHVNPGWTTNFTPDTLINWLRSLNLIELDQAKLFRLTGEGSNWAARIHWVPECLPAPTKVASSDQAVALAPTDATLQRPLLAAMIEAFPDSAVFADTLIARLDASLWSNERRHFAVLAGLSGAGKTLLARSYALALWRDQAEPAQGLYTLPVQPGWHDPVSLFGYVNPLSSDTYVRTGFLEFLLRASADPTRPYTVVLDEMNLSHPEQYLAPLLSAMETGDDIELHTFDEDISGVPPRLAYPSNLLIIGTVNMDETTHGLSDKILDRAAVLEFWEVDVATYPGWAASQLPDDLKDQARTALTALGKALRPVKLHFGWRSIGDILGYMHSAHAAGIINAQSALDHAIFSKILPKLRGEDTKRLREAFAQTLKVLQDAKLPESAAKLAELHDDLCSTGSARFWR